MPASRTDTRSVVAAFDVDGTLTRRDCVTPFLRRLAGVRLVTAIARHPIAVIRALVQRDNDRLKELASASLRGIDSHELERGGEAFAREIHDRLLRPDTLARLHRHRELGHAVVLASASFESYLAPLGRLLGVDGVVCTRLEVGADGNLTGRLLGANCRGAEKARRVREWLDHEGLADAELWAYGDSRGDAELLASADHPVWVHGTVIGADPGDTDHMVGR